MALKTYAVYQEDDLVYLGTAKECAEYLNITVESIRKYSTPGHHKKNYRTKVYVQDEKTKENNNEYRCTVRPDRS